MFEDLDSDIDLCRQFLSRSMESIHSDAFYQTTSKIAYFFLPDFLPDRSYLSSRTAETLDHYFEMIHLKKSADRSSVPVAVSD